MSSLEYSGEVDPFDKLIAPKLKDLIVIVREAEPSELPELFNLRWNVLRQPFGLPRGTEIDSHEYEPDTFHVAAFDRKTTNDETGPVVGVGRIHRVDSTDFKVRFMATDPQHTGRQIGSRVLAKLEELVTPHEPETISLYARQPAVEFYQKAGYNIIGPAPTFEGIPHLSMRKQLQ